MENRELQLTYPTTAELYALERAARAARAAEFARVFRALVRNVKSLFSAPKGLRHA